MATELFALNGIAATTFAMIAKQAGLTPAMLHYYFKDRERLLDAVFEERLLRFVSSVWDPVQPDERAPEGIRKLVERLLDGIEKMPWVPPLWVREVLNEGGLLRERLVRHLPTNRVQLLGRAIARGQAEGSLNPDVDPLLAVSSAVGLVMLHMATLRPWAEKFRRTPLDREGLERHICGLLLDGLCRKREGDAKIDSRRKINQTQKQK
jgi:AcrR family transcriptional regulator